MRDHFPASACQAKTGEESGCQLVPDASRDIGRPGKRALVMAKGAIPICPMCCATVPGGAAAAITANIPVVMIREDTASRIFIASS